jgi:outer membrane lipoprotein-sorting protein
MQKRNYTMLVIMILVTLLLILPATAFSANINTIVQQMENSYRQQLRGIEDMTVVQEMKGGFFNITITTYYKKAIVNNEEVFMSRNETSIMGMDTVTIFDGLYTWSNDPMTGEVEQEEGGVDALQVWKMFTPEQARYLGDEIVDGKDAYKLQLDDAIWMMGMEDMVGSDMPEDSEIEMQGIYWIDKETLVPLKAKNYTKTATVEDGETVSMNIITNVDFLDYRPVGSMLFSHRMLISTQYEFDESQMAGEDEDDFSAEEFMDFLESMGKMEIVVTNAEVNTGLPEELFDGTLLEAQGTLEMPDYSESAPMSEEDIGAMMEGIMDMMKDFMPQD